MTDKPEYRFKFQIVDETSGDVVESDFCALLDCDELTPGGSVDIHVGTMLRNWKTFARAEYERREYWKRCDVCDEKAPDLHRREVTGIETFACSSCCHIEDHTEAEANSQFGVGA